jgi:hypothetical protein
MFCRIADGLRKVILLQFLYIDNWAHLLTKTAIGAFSGIHLGIPKALNVSLEGDGMMGADIAAGVAAAAIYIILNLNHRMNMKYKDVTGGWHPMGFHLIILYRAEMRKSR